jgi:hypothetical protein
MYNINCCRRGLAPWITVLCLQIIYNSIEQNVALLLSQCSPRCDFRNVQYEGYGIQQIIVLPGFIQKFVCDKLILVLLLWGMCKLSCKMCRSARSCLSVRPSAWISSDPTGWIFVKFYIGCYEKLLRKFEIWLKSNKNIRYLQEDLSMLYFCRWHTITIKVLSSSAMISAVGDEVYKLCRCTTVALHYL